MQNYRLYHVWMGRHHLIGDVDKLLTVVEK